MYSSSSSSSSQSERSMGPTGLTRYGSAPSTLLTTAVDSVINNNSNNNNNNSSNGAGSSPHHHHNHHQEFSIFGSSPLQTASFNMAAPLPHPPPPQQQHRYFTGTDWPPLSPDSNRKVNAHNNPSSANLSPDPKRSDRGLQSSSGFLNINNNNNHSNDLHSANLKIGAGGSSSSTSNLVRHSSSPAGFLSHLMPETGFSAMRGSGSYSRGGSNGGGHGTSRLKPQLSFTRQDSALSHISEVNENVIEGLHSGNGHRDSQHTFAYGTDSWDNNSHSITFSSPSNKRAKNNGEGLFLNCLETQYSMPHAEMDKLLIPEDSVTCKIRAKRGCATHPRSIAERERRTRISGKLKKLQDLVPNMDKQTSYADMLDLAVQHIKGLQEQVEKLNKSQERCTCGCKLSKT